jgi:hypothetical protein
MNTSICNIVSTFLVLKNGECPVRALHARCVDDISAAGSTKGEKQKF